LTQSDNEKGEWTFLWDCQKCHFLCVRACVCVFNVQVATLDELTHRITAGGLIYI